MRLEDLGPAVARDAAPFLLRLQALLVGGYDLILRLCRLHGVDGGQLVGERLTRTRLGSEEEVSSARRKFRSRLLAFCILSQQRRYREPLHGGGLDTDHSLQHVP